MQFFTSLNQFLLDWGIGLLVFGTDCYYHPRHQFTLQKKMLEKPKGPSRDTGNIGHKTQNEDKQNKKHNRT